MAGEVLSPGQASPADSQLPSGASSNWKSGIRLSRSSPLDVDKSQSVIVLKRSMSSGFAGIDNPLFYDPKTSMLFGDAKSSVSEVLGEVQQL